EDISKGGYHVDFGDLETLIAMVIESRAPLVALGASGEQIGAGRIATTDEGWRAAFVTLAESAHVLFMLPADRSGTMWELSWLLGKPEVRRRTVFVVPPGYPVSSRTRANFHQPGSQNLTETGMTGTRRLDGEGEILQARARALEVLSRIIGPDDYTAVEAASDGALLLLGGESPVPSVTLIELKTARPALAYWGGPRFSKSHPRVAVTKACSDIR